MATSGARGGAGAGVVVVTTEGTGADGTGAADGAGADGTWAAGGTGAAAR